MKDIAEKRKKITFLDLVGSTAVGGFVILSLVILGLSGIQLLEQWLGNEFPEMVFEILRLCMFVFFMAGFIAINTYDYLGKEKLTFSGIVRFVVTSPLILFLAVVYFLAVTGLYPESKKIFTVEFAWLWVLILVMDISQFLIIGAGGPSVARLPKAIPIDVRRWGA